jgi:hypothetical protein
MNETWQIVGGLIGTGVVGAVLQGWWKARKDNRADAVDSANAKGQINMLADFERRAKDAEAEADRERDARMASDRAALKSDGVAQSAVGDLRKAYRDIVFLRRLLKKKGISDSDYVPMLETTLGDLPESKP